MAIAKVYLPTWMVPAWWKVAYKILPFLEEAQRQVVEVQPDARFNQMVGKYVQQLIEGGVQPPAEIATPVFNLASQVMNGHEMTMGIGDYIALQNFARRNPREGA
jgi:hypothetical protein